MSTTITVPYHLDERLATLDVGVPVTHEVSVELGDGGPWQRMAQLYEQLAGVVAAHCSSWQPGLGAGYDPLLVVSGDCTTSLGVLAGLQRAGHDAGVVWLDAHADFHTEQSSTSGYLGGMPLALAVGIGTRTLPAALGLRPVAEDRVLLVDARDTDAGEGELLDAAAVRRAAVCELAADTLPAGPLYLHVDADVCDPDAVPGLLYPAPGGPRVTDVLAALRRVLATGRVLAVGVAATWRQGGPARAEHERLCREISSLLDSSRLDSSRLDISGSQS